MSGRLTCLVLSMGVALACSEGSAAQSRPAPCPASSGEAALEFVRRGMEDRRGLVELMHSDSLRQYRQRLEQLFDDRYSPDSGPLRMQVFGSRETLRSLTDRELVARYLAFGRASAKLAGLRVVSRTQEFSGEEVAVAYRLGPAGESGEERRSFTAKQEQGCWRLDVPTEAWVRLDLIAKSLKASRIESPWPKVGASTVTLRMAQASEIEQPDAVAMRRHDVGQAGPPIWVSQRSVLTDEDVAFASAAWDCDDLLGPERAALRLTWSDEAGSRLRSWSEKNVGSTLAVVLDGQIVTLAKIASPLGSRLDICLTGMSLEGAQALAARLTGRSGFRDSR